MPLIMPSLSLAYLQPYFGRPSTNTISYAKSFGTRLYNFTNSPLSDTAANVLWGLRNISELLEAIHVGAELVDTPSATDLQFTDRVEVLERLAHRLWYVEDANSPQHAVFRTFGLACLIFIYIKLRELPKELGMHAMLASRIKTELEGCSELNILLATFQDLMLWEMFLCGEVADFRERPFFARQATRILMIRKLETKSEIVCAAQEFIWPERHKSTPIQRVYPTTPTEDIQI